MNAYRPEIDGLRALAIVPVVLFHAGFATFSGGYVGVDVFFVISGYLITSIILTERADGTFSFRRFYLRRARRILPALFTVALTVIPFAFYLLPPPALQDFFQSLRYVATFTANTHFYKTTGYFDTFADLKPLLHTWSLAVEEQFYLIFPLLLIAGLRLGHRLPLIGLVALSVASFGTAEWALRHDPAAGFFLLPARFWELGIGALAALYVSRNGAPRGRAVPALAGLILIGGSVFLLSATTPFPGFYALPPTVGTLLLILFATTDTVIGRLLALRALVAIGLVSYSLYLWHQPILALGRAQFGPDLGTPLVFAAITISVLLAVGTAWWIENPVRRPHDGFFAKTPRTVVLMIGVALVLIGIGEYGKDRDGFPDLYAARYLPRDQLDTYRLVQAARNNNFETSIVDDRCTFWAKTPDPAFVARFEACAAQHGPAVIVLGDSHAINLFNIAAKSLATPFLVGLSQGGCRPADAGPACQYVAFDTFARAHRETIRAILFHQSGAYLIADANGNVDSAAAFVPGAPNSIPQAGIDAITTYLADLDSIAPTLWLGPTQEAHANLQDPAAPVYHGAFRIDTDVIDTFRKLDTVIAGTTTAPYVSLMDGFAITPDFLRRGNCITYRDNDHFSDCGENLLAQKWSAILNAALTRLRL